MIVDITKPVVTTDGRRVLDLSIKQGYYPYIIRGRISENYAFDSWTAEGQKYRNYSGAHVDDIVNEVRATFYPEKPVQTRDGKPARIVATDAIGDCPIVALIRTGEVDTIGVYKSDGTSGCVVESPWDLVNKAPEKKTFSGWVVVYAEGSFGRIRKTRDEAIYNASSSRKIVACVQIRQTYEAGEGL